MIIWPHIYTPVSLMLLLLIHLILGLVKLNSKKSLKSYDSFIQVLYKSDLVIYLVLGYLMTAIILPIFFGYIFFGLSIYLYAFFHVFLLLYLTILDVLIIKLSNNQILKSTLVNLTIVALQFIMYLYWMFYW